MSGDNDDNNPPKIVSYLIFFALLIPGFFGIEYLKSKLPWHDETPATANSTNEVVSRETVNLTANQLYEDFSNNKLNADNKYGNKIVSISGFFQSVDKHYDDTYSFKMSIVEQGYSGRPDISQFRYVKIRTPESEAQRLAAIQLGDLVTVTCNEYVTSEDTFSDPELKDCQNVQVVASGTDGLLQYLRMMGGNR